MPHRQGFGRIVTFCDQNARSIDEGLMRHAKDVIVTF